MEPINLGPEFDVPGFKPDIPLGIQQAGISGRILSLTLHMNGSPPATVTGRLDMLVSVAPDRRGVHMSRLGQALQKCLSNTYNTPQAFLAHLGEEIRASQLARVSSVIFGFTWMQEEHTPVTQLATTESYAVHLGIETKDTQLFSIGVTAPGFIACPCVQLNARETLEELKDEVGVSDTQLAKLLEIAPIFSHSQRILVKATLTGPGLQGVDFRDLIGIIRNAIPQTSSILKRIDEVFIVRYAHLHPLFCEDVTRLVARDTAQHFAQSVPASTVIAIKTTSYESIHPDNLVATIEAPISELLR